MAAAHSIFFSTLTPSINRISRRSYPLLVVSSIPTRNPSRIRHRKNYLRPKILRTLTKRYSPITPHLPQEPPPQSNTLIPSPQTPQEHDPCVEIPAGGTASENKAATAGEGGKLEELQVSETVGFSGEHNGVAGEISARSVLKYGAYLVGVFVLQTIFSVWILSDDVSNQKAGDSGRESLDINVSAKRNLLFNENGKTMGITTAINGLNAEEQHELEKKVEEIKLMAREVRRIEEEKEEEEDEDEDSDIDDESAVDSHRLGIEKAIRERLLKLQNKMISDKNKSAASNINNLGNAVKPKGGVNGDSISMNVNQGSKPLMFEKKRFKHRIPSTKPTKTPKGFQVIRDHGAPNAKKRKSTSRGTSQENGIAASDHNGGNLVNEESQALLNNGKNLDEKLETPNVETEAGPNSNELSNGALEENSLGVSSVEVIPSRKSRELRTQTSQCFVKKNLDIGPILVEEDVLSITGSPKHGLTDNISAANRVKVKQTKAETNIWWLNLSYVLVILMRRGTDKGGPRGLYSLKITYREEYQSSYSFTVAFEDHADANNFCFILESFFEDLGDFSADAVPMSTSELHEAVKSHAKKVVVVKKRQLQLYAGQPLADVEMALCSIVEQAQDDYPTGSR